MKASALPERYRRQVPPKPIGPASDLFAKKRKVLLREAAVFQFFINRNIPLPMGEFRFHPTRKWRFDYCWPEYLLALEVEGGVWTGGRHTRGKGFLADCEKYNTAAMLRWCVLRVTPTSLMTAETADMLRRAMRRNA